ncbi:tripartite tricarboxylate transporter substrate binding protein [Alcaligenaceae bacterium]|nr:tripartite tricarboxylate transporter substrate binding protein [Alcaligenaceae bacterium]
MKKLFVRLGIAVLPVVMAAAPAQAQHQPPGPSRIIVGFPPGGSNDIAARLLAQHLGQKWGRPVVVENRPGANASIASTTVAASEPDGRTLLLTPPSSMIIESALRPTAFDPNRDLVPVSGVASVPYVLVVNTSVPAQTPKELVSYAKSQPGKINYGWANPGMRIATEILSRTTQTELFAVGYKGGSQSVPALLGNDVQMLLIDAAPVVSLIEAGKLRALAVSTPNRTAVLPDVPTMRESEIDFDWTGFMALYAPKGTSRATVDQIHADVAEVLKRRDVADRLLAVGVDANPLSPQDLGQYMERESKRIHDVLDSGVFKLD